MRTNLWRLTSIMILLAMLISPAGAASSAFAAPLDKQPTILKPGMQVIDASFVGVSQPLSSLAPVKVEASAAAIERSQQPRLGFPKSENALSNGGFDTSIVQKGLPGLSMPAPIANFEGVNNVSGVLPPDTQGDIGNDPSTGKKYYVQWVNLAFQIWDVTTPAAPLSLYGPAAGNTLWAGTGTICAANNDGDPITQFDHLANRWMMSQFALGFPNNFHQCIAVSATADPTGAWYLYDFQTSTVNMNDYPHFGVWSDGYYMSVNQFAGVSPNPWAGAAVAVFERTAMLAGLPARMIYIDTGTVTLNYGGMLPSDLDGPAPAVGTPNYFMEWDDSTWLGDAADTLRVWEFHTDWATPANTTFGLNANFDPNLMIATANVDPSMCAGSRNCVKQPGTVQGLDAIADRLMYRLQYRNFGTYQTLVGNHTVDSTGTDVAGIHWFELRNTGTGFAMNQEGVYAPDSDSRWMGSAAMDVSGDIALGFSVSSTTTYPSVRYTGRLAGDPAGTLPQGESTLIAGAGSQTHSAARWGDYSMMAVDPVDECTFWYTQEYIQTTGSALWQTRVGSFKFPSCTTAPTGTISGTVTDSLAAPLAGATVEASGGYSTITDATGHYALTLVAGTYSVTASKYGYVSVNAPAVVVTPPGATTQNFTLTASSTSTISGVVTDATTGWPLYASIDIFGYPSSPIFTDPLTGAYSVPLVNGSYTFTVTALSGGYTDAVLPLTVSATATQNFGLAASSVCSAPGYKVAGFTQNFETWPLAGWTVVDNIVGGGLTWDSNTAYADSNLTGGAGLAADVNSDANAGVNYNTELRTPVITLGSLANLNLVYKANYQDITVNDALDLDISLDGGTTWANISHWTTDHGSLYGAGVTVNVDLTPYATGDFMLRWHYFTSDVGPWDWYAQIDEVAIGASCVPIASSGLVLGAVKDANTNTEILNFSVEDAAMQLATIIDASADPARIANKVYLISQLSGTQNLTASAAGFGSLTNHPLVVAGGVVRQDFLLPSGHLSAAPTSLTFDVPLYAPTASKTLTINNIGSAGSTFDVFAVLGAAPAAPVPTGPFADQTRHVGPKNLNDRDATQLRVDLTPLNVALLPTPAGEMIGSWNPSMPAPWGIGFNTAASDLWIGNIGHNFDYRFLPSGFSSGEKINVSSWVASFGADMTYNPFTESLWQVNVGGDSCIYELDPVTKTSTGNKICPAFGTTERGLAYNPLTNTYYAGSWTNGIVNHFAPDGTLLDSKAVGLSISGLAFNPSTGHLFAMTNAPTATNSAVFDVYVLDTNNNYAILGGFNLRNGSAHAFANYAQAGLEMDCNGNLWAIDQGAGMVYQASSGETGACDWQLASWVTVTPSTSTVLNGGNVALTVDVDASGLKFMTTYQAHLRITNDTPYGNVVVPVTLNVGQTFFDVPSTHWANNFIQRLYWNGITGGCGASPLTYCPDANVTRAQMAVFLLRGEHGSTYVPPAVGTGTGFTDVPTSYWAAAWIKQLAVEGMTSGCTATTFCPDANVTRAEMAIFLLRGKHGAAYVPPAVGTGTGFTDVPTSYWAAAWIKQLAVEGITTGCTPTTYCPDSNVTRAEMAVFLVRAFSLP